MRTVCAAHLTCDIWSHIVFLVTDDDRVFKALADPTRRFLLDQLFARDGRTLTELESELEMSGSASRNTSASSNRRGSW